MDEPEQKQSKDTVSQPAASTSTVQPKSKESSSKLEMDKVDTSTHSATTAASNPKDEKNPAASSPTKTSPRVSPKKSRNMPSVEGDGGKKKEEGSSEEEEGSVKKPGVVPSGPAGKTKSMAAASACDKNLSRASSVPGVPPADGAGSSGSNDVMAKMMEVMAKGSASATPKNADKDKGPMGGMMGMSGGGMPDMMAMMSGGGGMPDMMSMMSAGGGSMADMKSMMTKMDGGMMATLFEHIIDASLNRSELESSSDDEDSISLEIPCKYCSRLFTSQMSLKTHILVAHEHEDSSVLNIQKLVIDKGKRSAKGHGSRRKQSKDLEKSAAIEAASDSSHQGVDSALSKLTSSQEDLSAAESSRGVKRGRSERSGSEAAESSGAAGLEESSLVGVEGLLRLGTGAVPSSCVSSSPPESRKRSARLRSLRSTSGDTSLRVTTTKRSKSGVDKADGDHTQQGSPGEEPAQPVGGASKSGDEQSSPEDPQSQSTGRETSKYKQIKADSKQPSPSRHTPVTRGKRVSRKDADTSGRDKDVGAEAPAKETGQGGRGRKGRQSSNVPVGSSGSVPVTGSSTQGSEAVSTSRRSLRSHKSH